MDVKFTREFLQSVTDEAERCSKGGGIQTWMRAYQRLADAADHLDALQARTSLPPESVEKG